MFIAALKDQAKVVKLLLDLGAVVDKPNEVGVVARKREAGRSKAVCMTRGEGVG